MTEKMDDEDMGSVVYFNLYTCMPIYGYAMCAVRTRVWGTGRMLEDLCLIFR